MSTRVRTLGTLQVFHDSTELSELPSQRLKCAMLVYLGVERQATRAGLMALFWPDRSEERARHSLSQVLYELRQDLGGDWLEARGDLVNVGSDLEVDAVSFREAVDEERYEAAAELYGGPFLKGIHLLDTHGFESWLDRQRSALGRLHRRARSEVVQQRRAAGDQDRALAVTREWVEHDPLDDEAQHLLIELMAETGQRTEALRQYREYESLLRDELELEPLEHTRSLVERIREGGTTPSPTIASSPEPKLHEATSPLPGNGEWTESQLAAELASEMDVIRLLGRGSMASVFLARDAALQRLVAIKVLKPELAQDGTSRMRFEREARSAARISHAHVATIYAVGALRNGAPYIAMEYVRGRTLAEHKAAKGMLEIDEVRRVLTEVASGLAAAHEKRVVHRDVRPSNVLIEEPSGRAVLTDFGVAAILATGEESAPRLTKTGEIIGNPVYLSPEQLAGGAVTEEADVYSLGMMAYELLTSTSSRSDPAAMAQLLARGTRISDVRPDVDQALEDLVSRCLAERPEHRPTATEAAEELAKAPPRTSVPAPTPGSPAAPNLLSTLLERRIPHTVGAFIAGAWLVYEAMSELLSNGVVPQGIYDLYLVLLPVGFVAATVVAWFHGKRGRQTMPRIEVWILSGLAVVWIAASVLVLTRP